MSRALRLALSLTLGGAWASPAFGEAPSSERLLALLPPRLEEVALPLPPLGLRPGEDEVHPEDKLAFMAELGRRVDARHQYSRTVAWLAIMGWEEPETMGLLPPSEPLDVSLDRYPVPAGRSDPAIDFRASVALAWLDSRRFSCQFPLRARFLAAHGLTPPGPLPVVSGACPAFANWVDPRSVDVDVIYVAQRWQDASATMGHLIFRLRKRPGEHVVGASSEVAFAYVAKDPADTPGYMWKGLTGGLEAGVELERFGEMWARYGVREGRDLHVFRLVLSDEERLFFLAEVFAQSRHRMRIPYAFLTVNCATMAWDTLRAVLPELPAHDGLLVHPHEVVSMLVTAHRATARGTIPARKTLARDAERQREVLAERLGSIPALSRAHAARWDPPATRVASLRALLDAVPGLSRSEQEALTGWADLTLDIEAFALDQQSQGYRPGDTGPALEAALELRAALTPAASTLASLEVHADPEPIALVTAPSPHRLAAGSRQAMVNGHALLGATPRVGLSLTSSVIDEQVGDARLVTLNPAARMRLLVNELVVSAGVRGGTGRDGAGPSIERDRLVLVDSLTLGDAMRTDNGWFTSRLGFGFGAELMSLPRLGVPFAARAHGGPALTLLASPGFASHLALTLELELASWTRVDDGDALLRTGLALTLEGALALGESRLRFGATTLPALDLGGFALEIRTELGLEVPLLESGLTLVAGLAWARGLPLATPLEVSLGLAY